MTAIRILVTTCLSLALMSISAVAQNVLEDDGVGVTYGELEYIVSNWPPHMQQSAALDEGDRLELLNMILVIKKLAREADQIPPDTETYYRYKTTLDSEKRNFVLKEFVANMEVPDMTELSKERYETQKNKYARVLERRTSSHILISCRTGSSCMRPDAEKKAQELLEQLRAGADFEEMVKQYSGDPGSKDKGGKFDRWISMADKGVSPPYQVGLFGIEEVGDYSEIVNSQFGVHIIRLDGIEEASFLPYEDVKDEIITDLETEYRKLALKDYRAQFNISEDAYIDGDAMDGIFSKYGTSN